MCFFITNIRGKGWAPLFATKSEICSMNYSKKTKSTEFMALDHEIAMKVCKTICNIKKNNSLNIFHFFHPSFHEKSIFFYFLFFFSYSVERCLLKFSWIKTCRPNLSWANQGMTLGRNRKLISRPSLAVAHVSVKRCKTLFRNLMFHNKNFEFFLFKININIFILF